MASLAELYVDDWSLDFLKVGEARQTQNSLHRAVQQQIVVSTSRKNTCSCPMQAGLSLHTCLAMNGTATH